MHWHMNHKLNCEGRNRSIESNHEEFKIYTESVAKSSYQTRNQEEEAKIFI